MNKCDFKERQKNISVETKGLLQTLVHQANWLVDPNIFGKGKRGEENDGLK